MISLTSKKSKLSIFIKCLV